MMNFLAMGGYGFYVWGSFGVAALVIGVEIWQIAARRAALLRAAPAADWDNASDES